MPNNNVTKIHFCLLAWYPSSICDIFIVLIVYIYHDIVLKLKTKFASRFKVYPTKKPLKKTQKINILLKHGPRQCPFLIRKLPATRHSFGHDLLRLNFSRLLKNGYQLNSYYMFTHFTRVTQLISLMVVFIQAMRIFYMLLMLGCPFVSVKKKIGFDSLSKVY